ERFGMLDQELVQRGGQRQRHDGVQAFRTPARNASSWGLTGLCARLLAKLHRVARLTPSTTSSACSWVNPLSRKACSSISDTAPRWAITASEKLSTASSLVLPVGWPCCKAITCSTGKPALRTPTAL